MHDQLVPYEQAWAWQRQQLAESSAAADAGSNIDALFILQHTPVYTLGAGSSEQHLKFDPRHPPAPLYRTERGGEVTYHGPGQLVLYPVLDLRRHTPDLHWYLRSLEEVVIRALASVSGLQGERLAGLTGVWVDGRKLAAIGVRARKWVTYHGLALNVTTDLGPFQRIVPCGIEGREASSVRATLSERDRRDSPGATTPGRRDNHGGSTLDVQDRRDRQDSSAGSTLDERDEWDGRDRQDRRDGRDSGLPGPSVAPAAILELLDEQMSASGSGAGPRGAAAADAELLRLYRDALLAAFSEVFSVRLHASPRLWSAESNPSPLNPS